MAIANAVDATQTGFQSLDSSGVWNGRTLTAGTNVSITNGDGIAGNPTISVSGSLQIGSMQHYVTANSTSYPNPDWLLCDGSVVSQASYPDLYTRLGLINEVGTNFLTQTTATITTIQNAVTFGNSIFVSAGNLGALYTSTDGITWTSRTSGTASTIRTIIYGNGIYVYAGNGGVLATSTDAITWTARTSGTVSSINSLLYANNLYVYGGNGGALATSTDAITWTARTSGTSSTIGTVTYLNSLYLYGGAAQATSTDAITWTARTVGSAPYAYYFQNSLYVGSTANRLYTSTDAITWTFSRQSPQNTIVSGTFPYGNILKVGSVYIGCGISLVTSTDGFNYLTQQSTFGPNALAYDGSNTVVAVGASGFSATSSVYSYNTATSFKLPTQYYYNQNVQDNTFSNLYIKAL